jgi:hypothetical protein
MSWQQSFASKAVVNSAEHPHIIWLQAIQDTHRHDILSEVQASPNFGSAIPNTLRRAGRLQHQVRKSIGNIELPMFPRL